MPKAREYGRFIVADPDICHGKLTFRGTRIFVSDVIDQVARGMDWDAIIWEWRGSISREAISEALLLGRDALLKQAKQETRARQRVAG